jgi:hypothetical protein
MPVAHHPTSLPQPQYGLSFDKYLVGPMRRYMLPYDQAPDRTEELPFFVLNNNILLNFPPRHWVFEEALRRMNQSDVQIYGRYFDAFGPWYGEGPRKKCRVRHCSTSNHYSGTSSIQ